VWTPKLIAPKIKTAEAKAWVRKYFKADSVANWFDLSDIKGIKDNKLISKPIQEPNQEEEDTAIKVPVIKVA
jgi:hypothetical protein